MTRPQKKDAPTAVRCAIYTRKSTEEGLDQDFNTLDAQRESAEAYIASQKSERWVCLPQHYDDGGFSGGNMDRPALNRLLADIAATNLALWGGSIVNPLQHTESGATPSDPPNVWTGSVPTGTPNAFLGSPSFVDFGQWQATNTLWIQWDVGQAPPVAHLYAISGRPDVGPRA